MKKVYLVILIVLSTLHASAQQTNVDSLYTIWEDNTKVDSIRVAAYVNYILERYIDSQPDTAAILADALHSFAKARKYPLASAKGYNLQGIASQNRGDFPQALEYYQKSLSLNEGIGNKKGIAGCLNNIGLIYRERGNNTRALEYYQRSMAIFEAIGEKNGLANSLNNIGNIYGDQRNFTRALEYMRKSLAVREELQDKRKIANSLTNFGVIYAEQGDTARALEYYQKSMKVSEEINDKIGISTNLSNIGVIYGEQANYLRALECHEKSLAIREKIGDKGGIAMSLNNLGYIYNALGKNNLAIGYCKRSLAIAIEIEALDLQKNACRCHYNTYKAMGKGNEALVFLEKMNVISDSINSQETAKKLEQMEFAKVMYQDSLAKVEEARLVEEAHQVVLRKKNQTRNYLLAGGLLALVLAAAVFNRLRFTRKAKAVLQVEKERSENLLLNILPSDVAEELKQKGKAEARDFDMVSIIFTDFKGFTEQSAQLSATALLDEINVCFEAFDGIMAKYGIEKIKTIGDAYMAAGGLPVPSDDSVKNTVMAALEMQKFIISRKAENDALGKPAFEMRIGIHTGPVVAGIVGVKKFQYDIWGDTVNIASRMESNGEVDKVNISETTYEKVKSSFHCVSRGKIEVKGKGEMEMYFVEAKS